MQRNSVAMKVSQDQGAGPPFGSYAQLVRMLMPLARKVAFYDDRSRMLWVTDGIEEAELSMQAQLLISRYVNNDPRERELNAHSALPEPVHVFPIRDGRGELLGALATQFDQLPSQAAYRNYATVQRMLAPLLDILQQNWRSAMQPKDIHWQQTSPAASGRVLAVAPIATPSVAPAATAKPAPVAVVKNIAPPREAAQPARAAPTALPAVMRSLLVEATDAAAASFGTIAVPGHAFSFNHRRNADESDLNVSAVADGTRLQMLQQMATHQHPLIINDHDASQTRFSDFKLLAYPIRINQGPLLALMVLFRSRKDPVFTNDDLTLLAEVTAQIPAAVLGELQRIHTTRTLALNYPAPVRVTAPVVQAPATTARPQQSDASALLPPENVEDEVDNTPDDAPIPVVVSAPIPTLIERVRTALSNDAFELYAQRIAPLHDYNSPERFEVLLRMPDKYGLQTPATFMAAAQAADLMPELDLWVIRHTLKMLRLNNRLGRASCELSVNVSAASLSNAKVVEQMLIDIRSANIKRGQLGFEVSESVAIAHRQAFGQLTEQLQDVGCRMTLDNCRTGIGIFDVLPHLTVNCIKIDGSIVRESGINAGTQSLLGAMVKRAAASGMESVAEHVESQLICSAIMNSGFDYAQGYHLELPAPLSKLFY